MQWWVLMKRLALLLNLYCAKNSEIVLMLYTLGTADVAAFLWNVIWIEPFAILVVWDLISFSSLPKHHSDHNLIVLIMHHHQTIGPCPSDLCPCRLLNWASKTWLLGFGVNLARVLPSLRLCWKLRSWKLPWKIGTKILLVISIVRRSWLWFTGTLSRTG